MAKGFTNFAHLMKDDDLAPLRSRADFAALVWEIAESSGQPAVGSKKDPDR